MTLFKFHVKPHIFLVFFLFFLNCFSVVGQKAGKVNIEVKELPALPARNYAVSGFLKSFPEIKSMSYDAAEWFYWTNYSRHSPKAFWDSVVLPILQVYPQFNTSFASSLKRALIKNNRLPMLKPNQALAKVSLAHAKDLAASGVLSHSSSNGTAFEQRVFKTGITKCAAENLTMGFSNPVFSLVLLYLDEGIPDLGHRNNLLNPYYVEMGVGISLSRKNLAIAVQDFACDQGKN